MKYVRIVVAALWAVVFSAGHAQQTRTRPAIGPVYGDTCNVPGYHGGFQAVCDARAAYVNWQGPLTYTADTEYKGRCLTHRTWLGEESMGWPFRGHYCPPNYSMRNSLDAHGCDRPDGQGTTLYHGPDQYCVAIHPIIDEDKTKDCPQCEASAWMGNPVDMLRGVKHETVRTGIVIGPLELEFHYDSAPKSPVADLELRATDPTPRVLGPLWSSNFHRKFVSQGNGDRLVARGDGRIVNFAYVNSTLAPAPDVKDRYVGNAYIDAKTGQVDLFAADGNPSQYWDLDGRSVTLTYSTTLTPTSIAPAPYYLIEASDRFGRKVEFRYELPAGAPAATGGRLSSVIDAAGRTTALTYDTNNNLASITWPDGRFLRFLYELPLLPWALTGIIDENGDRYATFGYDAQGRAVSTEYAGGVNRYAVTYTSPPQIRVTETYNASRGGLVRVHEWMRPEGVIVTGPLGESATLETAPAHGKLYLTGKTQAAGSGSTAANRSQTFDANGNLASRDDFNGRRTCYANDLGRNVETVRVEGLTNTQSCATVTADGSALPTGSRKTSTLWHPDWRLPTKVAEPGRITTHVYNGQPDPFNGNAVINCAVGGPVIGSKVVPVLCKKVEQATTDMDGRQGFAATLQPSVPQRMWQRTYNAYAQVLTERDPLGQQTSYSYYSGSGIDYALGDLQTVTNGSGQVTRYTKYNRQGQPLEVVAPNGVITTYGYDVRGRLVTSTTAGETTTYEYDWAGQLTRVALPGGSFIAYQYDAAHRLTSVSDSSGNRIAYTLDNAGNRMGQNARDPAGALASQLARVMDALGRTQQSTGRE